MNNDFETQYDKTAHEFNEFYINQEAHLSTDDFFSMITDEITSNIKNKNVLDLGYGAAIDASFYTKKGLIYYGLDASKEMCSVAKQNKYVTEIKNGSFSNKIPFDNNQFGLVVSKYAIQTSENIAPIYSEVTRVLDKDGYFIFLVVHPIRSFLEKKKSEKDYYKKEMVRSIIFGGKITVMEPSHTLTEYINKDFLNKFSLVDIRENSDFPNSEQINGNAYPTYLIIVAKKK